MTTMTETTHVLYTAKTHTTGGREGGESRTSDGRLDVKLSVPGTPGNGTNPEQLFAAGWSACLLSAMKIAAAKMKIHLSPDVAIDTEIDLCSNDEGYFLKARHNVSLPGIDHQTAQALVDAGEKLCPYTKATQGNIEVAFNAV